MAGRLSGSCPRGRAGRRLTLRGASSLPAARGAVALCYGTRPQVIKAAVLADALRNEHAIVTIDTGQHYDYELNGLLYEQLAVLPPSHCLGVGSAGAPAQVAAIVARAADVLEAIRPRAVIVIGDTNSTLGCALAAAQLRLPIVHVEAGLRSGNLAMVEEINRRVVDAIAAVLCAPTARTAEILRGESVPGAVHVTGDVAYDALLRAVTRVPGADQVPELVPLSDTPFVLATLHRAELVDTDQLLSDAVEALGQLGVPVLFAVHPRTSRALRRTGLDRRIPPSIRLAPPLGYLEALAAVSAAAVVVTDSGGIQREAYWLGTPCVTLRTETEWTETIDAGANRLVAPGEARDRLGPVVQRLLQAPGAWGRTALGDGAAAPRVSVAIGAVIDGGD